jgi:DNA-binding CsgD family transcriptional regulator
MGPDPQPSEIVGRSRELGEIENALDHVEAGMPWVLELSGEAGIGKSRLLAETCLLAGERGFLVLRGRAAEFEQELPFGMVVDALNDHVEALGPAAFRALDEDVLVELAEILPAMSGLGGEAAQTRGAAQRYRAHYALRALLERLAKSEPVLLALDDLHWADPASVEVLVHLLRRFRGRLLVGVAFRRAPRQLAAALEDAARAGSGSRLEIGPLTEGEATLLLDAALDAAVRDAVYRDSGGNPFYLEQLGRVAVPGPGAPLGEGAWLKESRIAPPRVIAAITDELDRLDAADRLVLHAAAVAGESFAPGVVATVAEVDEAAALDSVDALARAELIRTTSVPQRFDFRHPIVRRVVYDSMPAGWRVGAHARAAAALASAHASRAEMANHVARSAAVGDTDATDLLIAAAEDVAPRAPLTAGRWLLAAIGLLPGDDEEQRVRLLGEAGALMTSGGAYGEALEVLDEALAAAPQDSDALRASLIAKRAETRRRGGRPFASGPQLGQALRSRADAPQMAAVRAELAMDRYWHGDFEAVSAFSDELLEFARPEGDLLLISLAASLSSLASANRGELETAADQLAEAEAAFLELPDERLAERVYLNHYMSEAALRLERADAALAHFQRGQDVASATGQDATKGSWSGLAIYAHLLKGGVSEACAAAEGDLNPEALERDDWRQIWLLAADSQAALWRGESERALANARELVTRSERTHPGTIMLGLARLRLGSALLAGADAAGAARELQVFDSEPDRWFLDLDWGHGWDTLIRAHLGLGDVDSAGEAMRTAEARAVGLAQRVAHLSSTRAAVLLARGNAEAAADVAAEAVELAGSTGNPLLSGRCRVQLGKALAVNGRHEDAIAELERAERELSDCGAIREGDAAAQELRALGKRVHRRPRRDSRGGLAELSPREREVAGQVAEGKTNREIAAALFLSEKTIESHLARIYSKLDVHSRAALTAIVARGGLDAQVQGWPPAPTLS